MIAYYEAESQQPPGFLLAELATAHKISADNLIGLKDVSETRSPRHALPLERLQKILDLPAGDQGTVPKLLYALHVAHARTAPRR
ncbi:MAG: hypothetical protein A2Y78_06085 [Acidobacteria bacterium RBG_13_68_16]|nr:MAG: hypothetical protein A2Y78_06085 [Acidobacteria bacterium RBG_13_68_16]